MRPRASGAGRGLKESLDFGTVDEDFAAYGLLTHRHTPEMEQILGSEVLFTPHLAPMVRGILATCYARPAGTTSRPRTPSPPGDEAYDAEPFVVVTDEPPSTKATSGSNVADVTAGSTPAPAGSSPCAPSTTSSRARPVRRCSAPTPCSGLAETTGLPLAGVYP